MAGRCSRRCWRGSDGSTYSVRAFRNAIAYGGETADRRADLAEVMAAAAGGVVTAEAKGEIERALALDANDVKASYFLGLAAEQDGRKQDAAGIRRAMLAKGPQNAPWRPLVTAGLTRVVGEPPSASASPPFRAAPHCAGVVDGNDGGGPGDEGSRPARR